MQRKLTLDSASAMLGLGLILVAGAGLLMAGFTDFIVEMGHNIPQDDLVMDYSAGVLWAMALGVSIAFWPVPPDDKPLLMAGWLAKAVVTLGFMLFYENYYDTDSFGYFYNSRVMGFEWENIIMGKGTLTITTLMGLHHLVFPNSFHMMKVSSSMIGLLAVYLFYRAGVRFMGRDDGRVYYALALFPSILFWSSILGKDPVILLGVALYAYGAVAWYQTGHPRFLLPLAAGVVLSMFVRVWMGPILLAPLAIVALRLMRGGLARAAVLALILAGFQLSLNRAYDRFRVETQQDLISATQKYSHAQSVGGSGRFNETQFTDVGRIAGFIPVGMFTALFRPLPGEVLNAFGLMASLENLVLLIIFLRAVMRTRLSELGEPVVLWATALVLLWSASYGFMSFQNLGAAVRYKLQILPVFLGVLLYLNRERGADFVDGTAGMDDEPEGVAALSPARSTARHGNG